MLKFQDGNNLFFTSDTHFGHKNILTYQPNREFESVDAMNESMIQRWNAKVSPKDIVFHLGDFAFHSPTKAQEILSQLNGKIHLVTGNHDHLKVNRFTPPKGIAASSDMFESIRHYREIRVGKQIIILFHFPIYDWNMTSHGSWHFHGHTHNTYHGEGKILDVGIDATTDLAPFSYEELEFLMKDKQIKYHYENEIKV